MTRTTVAVLLLVLASSRAGAQVPATGDQRASAERLFDTWSRNCGAAAATPAKNSLAAWPPGQRFRYRFQTFFAQPVDDRLAGELEGNQRRLLLGALLPLGITAEAVNPVTGADREPDWPLLEVAGLGEALPPDANLPGIYTGASWKGLMALRAGGRCVAAMVFSARLRPPDALAAVAFEDPAAAPYLEALEAGTIDALVQLVQAIQGETGLSRVAMSEADWRLRTSAVQHLSDQAFITGVARGAKAPWLRAIAVGKLTSQARLDEIVQADKDADVRKAALDRLAELARREIED